MVLGNLVLIILVIVLSIVPTFNYTDDASCNADGLVNLNVDLDVDNHKDSTTLISEDEALDNTSAETIQQQ